MFTQEDLWQQSVACSGTFYLIIDDVEGYFAQVKKRADIAWPLQDMAHGSRKFGVRWIRARTSALARQGAATGR